MNPYLGLILIGSISGFIGGMLGGGSDVLIVPILLYLVLILKQLLVILSEINIGNINEHTL